MNLRHILLHYVTHIAVIFCHMPHFVSTEKILQINVDSLPNFWFFTVKSPSVTQRSISQEKAYKESFNCVGIILYCLYFFTSFIANWYSGIQNVSETKVLLVKVTTGCIFPISQGVFLLYCYLKHLKLFKIRIKEYF